MLLCNKILFIKNDPLHSAVQPARKNPAPEMVRGPVRQGQEENHPRADICHPGPEAQDVQLPGVEGPPGSFQKKLLESIWPH